MILDRDLSHIEPVDLNDPAQIQEFVAHSWYDYSAGKTAACIPMRGETTLDYTRPQAALPATRRRQVYSWLKSPRWRGKAMEVGPLARVLMLYAKGHEQTARTGRLWR